MAQDKNRLPLRVLDEFLLTGNLLQQDIVAFLARVAGSDYSRHLVLTNLVRGLPENEKQARQALIRLRLLFDDNAALLSEFVANLYLVGTIFRLVEAYLRGNIYTQMLIVEHDRLREEYSCKGLNYLFSDLSYPLSLADADVDDPYYAARIDVLQACIKTQSRLRHYWYAAVGEAP